MQILIANDDGYLSPGIQSLQAALSQISTAIIVAPDRNRSGASNSLTLSHPVLVKPHGDFVYSVEGTPTDCVNIALSGLLDTDPDMVVSGINDGPNMGDDVLYSGTVAAAVESRFLGHPAIAVSMGSHKPQHYDAAAAVVVQLIERMQKSPLPADTILNVNVPDLPFDAIKGLRATRLGTRHHSTNAILANSPRDETAYWIGPAGEINDDGIGTDFAAIKDQFVSVTPLQIDMTRHDTMTSLASWLEQSA